MTQIEQGWGADPSDGYDALAAQFRPIFARIRAGAVQREHERALPLAQMGWLKAARFGALRLPRAQGGFGAGIPDLFNLQIELSEADSNLTQGLRAHFGFVEDILNTDLPERRALWAPRIARGEIVANAWTEVGEARQGGFATTVSGAGDAQRVSGVKYYSTGSYFADWIDVGAVHADGRGVNATVARDADGVTVIDDWDGFGQRLTASGTARFAAAPVAAEHVVADTAKPKYLQAFAQTVHLATLAGIGRAAAGDVARLVGERRRNYSHAAAARSAQDPQVLQVVGRVRGAAYAAGSIVLRAAGAIQRACDAHAAGDAAAEDAAVVLADVEVSQAVAVVPELILNATTVLFDALGASAISRRHALDRYWRNARTLASHNPRIYKERIVGDFAVNGTPPPGQWRVGVA